MRKARHPSPAKERKENDETHRSIDRSIPRARRNVSFYVSRSRARPFPSRDAARLRSSHPAISACGSVRYETPRHRATGETNFRFNNSDEQDALLCSLLHSIPRRNNKEAFERGVLSKRKAHERSSLFISLLARVLPACLSQIHLTRMRTGFCFFLTTDINISKTSILFASLAGPDGEFENFSIASRLITIA